MCWYEIVNAILIYGVFAAIILFLAGLGEEQ